MVRRLGMLGVGAWLAHAMLATAVPSEVDEYQLKAAFLYKFAKFVRWPAGSLGSSDTSFPLCVLGEDPFGAVLDRTVDGKRIRERLVEVRRIPAVDAAGGCRVLFVSASLSDRLGVVLDALAGTSALTVGDVEHFAHRGGMISIRMQHDRRTRFEINMEVVERAGLEISSELLSLSTIVGERREGGG